MACIAEQQTDIEKLLASINGLQSQFDNLQSGLITRAISMIAAAAISEPSASIAAQGVSETIFNTVTLIKQKELAIQAKIQPYEMAVTERLRRIMGLKKCADTAYNMAKMAKLEVTTLPTVPAISIPPMPTIPPIPAIPSVPSLPVIPH